MRNANGFSEIEFTGLIVAGLLVAGLLAHFIFDQSIQVKRLRAMVARDRVRLTLEDHLLNPEILKKSAQHLPETTAEYKSLRSCFLPQTCQDKSGCCLSRVRKSMPIYTLGEDSKIVGGTMTEPACLNELGDVVQWKDTDCFATVKVSLEPVCAKAAAICHLASSVLIRYQILFSPKFLSQDPELGSIERTLSLMLDVSTPTLKPQ